MSRFVYIIGNGHGGLINGVPQTAGNRSVDFGDGILYEGVTNREIAAIVLAELCELNIPAINLVPELEDISLAERVRRVNRFKNAIYFSLHCDGFHLEKANGWSAYTYYGQSDSDKIANILYKKAEEAKLKLRKDLWDGDPDKEAGFYVLKNTNCPAVLVENLFMTNKKNNEFLRSEDGKKVLAKVIVDTIVEIEENGL
ncbi:N-acetylmuramoyl-L-alanine amidase [Candidatus Babeliales bacterium]|nr:N-acetylmuramoyl-L-alanine amidase [Candidatus Babeliales bacterium]